MEIPLVRNQNVHLDYVPAGVKLMHLQFGLFLGTLNDPLDFALGNIQSLGETKLTVSLGVSH